MRNSEEIELLATEQNGNADSINEWFYDSNSSNNIGFRNWIIYEFLENPDTFIKIFRIPCPNFSDKQNKINNELVGCKNAN